MWNKSPILRCTVQHTVGPSHIQKEVRRRSRYPPCCIIVLDLSKRIARTGVDVQLPDNELSCQSESNLVNPYTKLSHPMSIEVNSSGPLRTSLSYRRITEVFPRYKLVCRDALVDLILMLPKDPTQDKYIPKKQ